MEFEYLGGTSVKLYTKKSSLTVDINNLEDIGVKIPTKSSEISLYSRGEISTSDKADFSFSTPGEYEVHNISIRGIGTQGYSDEAGTKRNVIYRLIVNDVRVAFIGSINPDLSDDQLELIGTIDILFIPVGGGGVTLDGAGALKVIKSIEPKIIVPIYYADKGLKYPEGLVKLDDALRELAMEPSETLDKLKVKNKEFAEATKLVILNRQ